MADPNKIGSGQSTRMHATILRRPLLRRQLQQVGVIAITSPNWLIRSVSFENSTIRGSKIAGKNRALPNRLMRKNIRRRLAAKIRCLFKNFFESTFPAIARVRLPRHVGCFPPEGTRDWNRDGPASGRIGKRNALRGPRGRRRLRGSRGGRLRGRICERIHARTGGKWQKTGACYCLL